MNKFNKRVKSIVEELIFPFEDYSNKIKESSGSNLKSKCFEYVDCSNHCIISEDSLSRILNVIKNNDFAILTAYRGNFSKSENILRNRKLRGILNAKKIGVHQLVGHWQEAPTGNDYTDCTSRELTDVVERSYLIKRPSDMSYDEFEALVLELLTIDGETQDAAILKNDDGIFLLYNNGTKELIGNDVSLGKINQAYSQYVKNNLPFVFEGIEIPATNLAKQMYTKHHILF